jgi:inositol-phosphate transport system substrate-binding protein
MPGLAQEVVLKAWTIGPDDPSVYRATNLHTAAERLNAELMQAGAPERVKVDTDFWTGQAQQYGQRVLLAFQSGDIPDIVLNDHEFVGRYATAGYIRPLDDLLIAYQAALADLYPVLWQAVHFRDQIWGLPQDTEARMIYVRTDHLRQLGWSAEAIADLPLARRAGGIYAVRSGRTGAAGERGRHCALGTLSPPHWRGGCFADLPGLWRAAGR